MRPHRGCRGRPRQGRDARRRYGAGTRHGAEARLGPGARHGAGARRDPRSWPCVDPEANRLRSSPWGVLNETARKRPDSPQATRVGRRCCLTDTVRGGTGVAPGRQGEIGACESNKPPREAGPWPIWPGVAGRGRGLAGRGCGIAGRGRRADGRGRSARTRPPSAAGFEPPDALTREGPGVVGCTVRGTAVGVMRRSAIVMRGAPVTVAAGAADGEHAPDRAAGRRGAGVAAVATAAVATGRGATSELGPTAGRGAASGR